jgi:hypothetical protein
MYKYLFVVTNTSTYSSHAVRVKTNEELKQKI